MTAWWDVPAVSVVTIRELGRILPVESSGRSRCPYGGLALAISAEQAEMQKKKTLNGKVPQTWMAVDVLRADYRVGQAVIRKTSQSFKSERSILPVEGLGWVV